MSAVPCKIITFTLTAVPCPPPDPPDWGGVVLPVPPDPEPVP